MKTIKAHHGFIKDVIETATGELFYSRDVWLKDFCSRIGGGEALGLIAAKGSTRGQDEPLVLREGGVDLPRRFIGLRPKASLPS